MVIARYIGKHVFDENRPRIFRTSSGRLLAIGTGLGQYQIESLFSRKDENANLQGVRNQHSETAASFDSRRNRSIHITNNAPNISRLNDGWSAQTPAGFFERGIMEARKAVRTEWRRLWK